MKLLKAIKAIWDWVFPWKYLRNARRECKHCGTRQDTYSTNWSDGHNSYWWETMSPVRSCKRINHGEVYPAPRSPDQIPPWERDAIKQLEQDDMDRELAGGHYKQDEWSDKTP